MGRIVRNKRFMSIVIALMMVLSLSLSVCADTGGVMEVPVVLPLYTIRASTTYKVTGHCDVTQYDTKTGSIMCWSQSFALYKDGKYINIPSSFARWEFTISSFKEGGKITLTLSPGSVSSENFKIYKKYKLVNMTGKIHLKKDSKTGKNYIWKIDSFGTGFYIRND